MSNTTKLLLIVCLSLFAHAARAATDTAVFNVTATVVSSCTVSATDLNFGTIGPATSGVQNSSNLTVNCSNGTPYTITLSPGQAGSASSRAMKHTDNTSVLSYGLYVNSTDTAAWGDGTNGTTTFSGTGTGTSASVPVHGKLAAVSSATPGSYSDQITVTIDF